MSVAGPAWGMVLYVSVFKGSKAGKGLLQVRALFSVTFCQADKAMKKRRASVSVSRRITSPRFS